MAATDRAETYAVLAGGGTAGHVLPALAVAEALVVRGHDPETLQFVGARRGVEATLVPEAGFRVWLQPVQGVRRSASPANVKAGVAFGAAVPRALALLRRLRPRVVVSVGGYASVPPVVAAKAMGIPIVVLSYDAVPGAAARLGSRLARTTAVAFDDSPLRRAVVTGTPLRRAIVEVDVGRDRAAARAALGLPADRFVLLAFGGSLGSGMLNGVVASFVAANAGRADLAVRHVVGPRHEAELGAATATAADLAERPDALMYQAVRYEDRMHLAYAAADLLLARSGATTVAEVAALGVPAVLVPWPLATEDHQTANARVLACAGAAVLVPEAELTAERLTREVDRLAADREGLVAMAGRARALGRRDAADRIAALVEQVASAPRRARPGR